MRAAMTSPDQDQDPRAHRFLRACRGEPVDTTPIWIMRQAGRYLPDYRKTREKAGDFLTLCKTPALACEVTLQPVELLGVDAAILFSDILIPLEAMGMALSFSDGEGPRLEPVRSEEGVSRLRVPEADEEMGFVMEAVRLIVKGLGGKVPLIGFAGAPWTMMSYAVEGKTSKSFEHARRMLYEAPALAHALLEKITQATIGYLKAQVRAGAQALQLFESWGGALSRSLFDEFALPYAKRIVEALRPEGVPFIYFCNEIAAHLPAAGTSGASVLGVDFRLPLDVVRARLGEAGQDMVLQGNLDPMALFAKAEVLEKMAADVIRAGGEKHIFNLGHGITPGTPPESAIRLVEAVHRVGRRDGSQRMGRGQ